MPLLPQPVQGQPPSPSTGTPVIVQLSSTALTAVLTYTPPETAGFVLACGLEVTVAPTTVQVYLQYTGPDGNLHTLWLTGQNGWWTLAPDDYSFLPASFAAMGGKPITLYAQAQTAGQVTVTATLWQEV